MAIDHSNMSIDTIKPRPTRLIGLGVDLERDFEFISAEPTTMPTTATRKHGHARTSSKWGMDLAKEFDDIEVSYSHEDDQQGVATFPAPEANAIPNDLDKYFSQSPHPNKTQASSRLRSKSISSISSDDSEPEILISSTTSASYSYFNSPSVSRASSVASRAPNNRPPHKAKPSTSSSQSFHQESSEDDIEYSDTEEEFGLSEKRSKHASLASTISTLRHFSIINIEPKNLSNTDLQSSNNPVKPSEANGASSSSNNLFEFNDSSDNATTKPKLSHRYSKSSPYAVLKPDPIQDGNLDLTQNQSSSTLNTSQESSSLNLNNSFTTSAINRNVRDLQIPASPAVVPSQTWLTKRNSRHGKSKSLGVKKVSGLMGSSVSNSRDSRPSSSTSIHPLEQASNLLHLEKNSSLPPPTFSVLSASDLSKVNNLANSGGTILSFKKDPRVSRGRKKISKTSISAPKGLVNCEAHFTSEPINSPTAIDLSKKETAEKLESDVGNDSDVILLEDSIASIDLGDSGKPISGRTRARLGDHSHAQSVNATGSNIIRGNSLQPKSVRNSVISSISNSSFFKNFKKEGSSGSISSNLSSPSSPHQLRHNASHIYNQNHEHRSRQASSGSHVSTYSYTSGNTSRLSTKHTNNSTSSLSSIPDDSMHDVSGDISMEDSSVILTAGPTAKTPTKALPTSYHSQFNRSTVSLNFDGPTPNAASTPVKGTRKVSSASMSSAGSTTPSTKKSFNEMRKSILGFGPSLFGHHSSETSSNNSSDTLSPSSARPDSSNSKIIQRTNPTLSTRRSFLSINSFSFPGAGNTNSNSSVNSSSKNSSGNKNNISLPVPVEASREKLKNKLRASTSLLSLTRSDTSGSLTVAVPVHQHHLSQMEKLLGLTTSGKVEEFDEYISKTVEKGNAKRLRKLNEASFSEVFIQHTNGLDGEGDDDITDDDFDCGGVSTAGPGSVVHGIPGGEGNKIFKVIPFGHEELPTQSSIQDVIQELQIARLVDSMPGFISIEDVSVVRGRYPGDLLREWDTYNSAKGSANTRPDVFNESQLFCVIVQNDAGIDLETKQIPSWIDAESIFWQTVIVLAQAEQYCQFEHRDLHWGNLVIKDINAKSKKKPSDGNSLLVPDDGSSYTGVGVSNGRVTPLLMERPSSAMDVVPPGTRNSINAFASAFTASPSPNLGFFPGSSGTMSSNGAHYQSQFQRLNANPQTRAWLRYLEEARRSVMGRSSLRVTLIDYTLSRAYNPAGPSSNSSAGTVIHTRMDQPEFFRGKGDYQFDIYRFMRNHVSSAVNTSSFNTGSNEFHFGTSSTTFSRPAAARHARLQTMSISTSNSNTPVIPQLLTPQSLNFNFQHVPPVIPLSAQGTSSLPTTPIIGSYPTKSILTSASSNGDFLLPTSNEDGKGKNTVSKRIKNLSVGRVPTSASNSSDFETSSIRTSSSTNFSLPQSASGNDGTKEDSQEFSSPALEYEDLQQPKAITTSELASPILVSSNSNGNGNESSNDKQSTIAKKKSIPALQIKGKSSSISIGNSSFQGSSSPLSATTPTFPTNNNARQSSVDNTAIDWSKFCPHTNVLWLHYISDKLLYHKGLPLITTTKSGRLQVRANPRGGSSVATNGAAGPQGLATAISSAMLKPTIPLVVAKRRHGSNNAPGSNVSDEFVAGAPYGNSFEFGHAGTRKSSISSTVTLDNAVADNLSSTANEHGGATTTFAQPRKSIDLQHDYDHLADEARACKALDKIHQALDPRRQQSSRGRPGVKKSSSATGGGISGSGNENGSNSGSSTSGAGVFDYDNYFGNEYSGLFTSAGDVLKWGIKNKIFPGTEARREGKY